GVQRPDDAASGRHHRGDRGERLSGIRGPRRPGALSARLVAGDNREGYGAMSGEETLTQLTSRLLELSPDKRRVAIIKELDWLGRRQDEIHDKLARLEKEQDDNSRWLDVLEGFLKSDDAGTA